MKDFSLPWRTLCEFIQNRIRISCDSIHIEFSCKTQLYLVRFNITEAYSSISSQYRLNGLAPLGRTMTPHQFTLWSVFLRECTLNAFHSLSSFQVLQVILFCSSCNGGVLVSTNKWSIYIFNISLYLFLIVKFLIFVLF